MPYDGGNQVSLEFNKRSLSLQPILSDLKSDFRFLDLPGAEQTSQSANGKKPGATAVKFRAMVSPPDCCHVFTFLTASIILSHTHPLRTAGGPIHEAERNKAEGPQTEATLTRGFRLEKNPVKQGQYEAGAGTNPSHFKAVGKDAPVEEVSWVDAMDYCNKLTAQERTGAHLPEGYASTLPTAAQWELWGTPGRRKPMRGDSLICQAMCSSGASIGLATIPAGQWLVPPGGY